MNGGRVLRAPRVIARRVGTNVERYRHALRPVLPDEELLRRAAAAVEPRELAASFRACETHFFFDAGDAERIARFLAERAPGWREHTIADADRIVSGVVRLLGADEVDVRGADGSTRWHEDMLAGYRWNPRTFYKQIEIPYDRADVKVPWELSRCQHLPTLGMAYLATGDERYAAAVTAQIDDWIAANRAGYGVNWACAMDVAIRAVNWLWAFRLVAGAPSLSDAFVVRLLASLVTHGRHVSGNIEIYQGVPSNHTLSDYTGLLYLGLLLPRALPEADAWTETAIDGIEHCMRVQVHADGVDFENSIAYHRLVLEMFLGCHLLAESNGRSFTVGYRDSLVRMLEFVGEYTRPDGLAPLVGDSDDGRLQILSRYFDWHPQDHRYVLGAGAAAFGRVDLASVAGGAPGVAEEAAWLVGTDASSWVLGLPREGRRSSHAFPEGGRYVMRAGDGNFALVSTDEVGTGGRGNHKHNDILSFELVVDGVPVAVDPGSYLYTSDRIARDAFRSTRSHNTLMVDREEQNEPIGPFWMRTDARVAINAWRPGEDLTVLDAEHSGYRRLPRPVTHRRCLCLRRDPFAFLVVDTLLGEGTHEVESFLHLATGGRVEEAVERPTIPDLDALTNATGAERPLAMRTAPAVRYTKDRLVVAIVPLNFGSVALEEGWVSPRYGRRERAPLVRLSGVMDAGTSVGYVVVAEARVT